MESKEYSWKWVTSAGLLSLGPCELLSASLYPTSDAGSAVLYDGENTNGDIIITLKGASQTNVPFSPAEPVYCRRGLYINVTNASIFVQWRELGQK